MIQQQGLKKLKRRNCKQNWQPPIHVSPYHTLPNCFASEKPEVPLVLWPSSTPHHPELRQPGQFSTGNNPHPLATLRNAQKSWCDHGGHIGASGRPLLLLKLRRQCCGRRSCGPATQSALSPGWFSWLLSTFLGDCGGQVHKTHKRTNQIERTNEERVTTTEPLITPKHP